MNKLNLQAMCHVCRGSRTSCSGNIMLQWWLNWSVAGKPDVLGDVYNLLVPYHIKHGVHNSRNTCLYYAQHNSISFCFSFKRERLKETWPNWLLGTTYYLCLCIWNRLPLSCKSFFGCQNHLQQTISRWWGKHQRSEVSSWAVASTVLVSIA